MWNCKVRASISITLTYNLYSKLYSKLITLFLHPYSNENKNTIVTTIVSAKNNMNVIRLVWGNLIAHISGREEVIA